MKVLGYSPAQIRKALVGGVVAGIVAAGYALSDGVITGPEAGGIIAAVAGGIGAVFGIKNAG